jgi:hypothetical protein
MLSITGGVIEASQVTGIHIEGRSDATVRGATIDHAAVGIRVHTSHRPLIEDCTVSDTQSGLEVGPGTSPTVRRCRFTRAAAAGVFLDRDSTAVLDRCDITEIGGSGLVVWTGAKPTIRHSTISQCRKNGLYLAPGSGGEVEDCTISKTEFPALFIGPEAEPVLSRCHIHDVDEDLHIDDLARAVFTDCTTEDVRAATMPTTSPSATTRSRRGAGATQSPPGHDSEPKPSLEDLLADLNDLIGLDRAKQDVGTLVGEGRPMADQQQGQLNQLMLQAHRMQEHLGYTQATLQEQQLPLRVHQRLSLIKDLLVLRQQALVGAPLFGKRPLSSDELASILKVLLGGPLND